MRRLRGASKAHLVAAVAVASLLGTACVDPSDTSGSRLVVGRTSDGTFELGLVSCGATVGGHDVGNLKSVYINVTDPNRPPFLATVWRLRYDTGFDRDNYVQLTESPGPTPDGAVVEVLNPAIVADLVSGRFNGTAVIHVEPSDGGVVSASEINWAKLREIGAGSWQLRGRPFARNDVLC